MIEPWHEPKIVSEAKNAIAWLIITILFIVFGAILFGGLICPIFWFSISEETWDRWTKRYQDDQNKDILLKFNLRKAAYEQKVAEYKEKLKKHNSFCSEFGYLIQACGDPLPPPPTPPEPMSTERMEDQPGWVTYEEALSTVKKIVATLLGIWFILSWILLYIAVKTGP